MQKAYEKYKESGVEWIGNVPNHWEPIRLKFLGALYSGLSGKKGDDFRKEDSEFNHNYIPFTNIANNFEIDLEKLDSVEIFPDENQNQVEKNDLFFLMSSENYDDIGKTAILLDDTENTYLNSFCKGFRLFDNKDLDAKFLNYLLSGDVYRKILSIEAKGFTRINLQMGKIQNLPVVIPASKMEQSKIAAFLDYHTTLIDSLIDKKEKLIEKLQEQRQAIINEAVTKGLNPGAELKDSRIDWLGNIPKHWKFIKISSVAKQNQYSITGGPFGSDLKNEEFTPEGVRIIQLQNIGVGEFRDHYKIYTSEEKADELFSCNIFPGDLIIAKMADPVARACIMPDFDRRYIMASDGIRFEVNDEKVSSKFLEYAINSKYFNFQAELKSTGTTRLRIGLTEFKKLKLLLPPRAEQDIILEFLEGKDSSIKKSIDSINISIQKLKEYRQSLISEAVTGKIDVRDWQKPNDS
ncbi:hypothetical protein BTO09_06520 [Gilvibacter sp. SZ-19]|uniref:restriction endonuclease subunit S n=1 Tax=Gilvibacter sp. SZ-19 TaxID=754429 RepID=UPI000B3C5721|nr:restriction endonuclease subunit S [Gilvibacter sp. SZ-19]ARV12021.1 hypothetical protein BTO09_06520 [Gilvibacter sp. SZ-19]